MFAKKTHNEQAIEMLNYLQKRPDSSQAGAPPPRVELRYQNVWEGEQCRFAIYGHLGEKGYYFSEVVLFADGTWRFLA